MAPLQHTIKIILVSVLAVLVSVLAVLVSVLAVLVSVLAVLVSVLAVLGTTQSLILWRIFLVLLIYAGMWWEVAVCINQAGSAAVIQTVKMRTVSQTVPT